MFYKRLGILLKDGRKAAGLSQEDAAKHIGVTNQNVSSWELGKSKIDANQLLALCNLYSISFSNVMAYAAEQKEPATGEGDGLNAREHELIRLFRLIPEDRQEFVLRMVEAALDKQAL